jgi:ribosome-binding protein aMBF1 (putative translation factor)
MVTRMQTKGFQTDNWIENAPDVPGSDNRLQSEAIAERFGENLRRLRRRAGMSQEELAERASLHRTQIGLIERGLRVGRIDTLIKLASALDASPLELLEGIHWTVAEPRKGRFSFSGPGATGSQSPRRRR